MTEQTFHLRAHPAIDRDSEDRWIMVNPKTGNLIHPTLPDDRDTPLSRYGTVKAGGLQQEALRATLAQSYPDLAATGIAQDYAALEARLVAVRQSSKSRTSQQERDVFDLTGSMQVAGSIPFIEPGSAASAKPAIVRIRDRDRDRAAASGQPAIVRVIGKGATIARPALQAAKPHVIKAGKTSGKAGLKLGKLAYSKQSLIPVRIRLAALSGLALLTVPGDSLQMPTTGISIADAKGQAVPLPPLELPYSMTEVNEGFKAINAIRFAPGGPVQKKKIADLLHAEKELARLDAAISHAPTPDLRAQHAAKAKALAALPKPKFNDKLLIMNGVAGAIVLTPRTAFTGLLKDVAPTDLYGRMVAHGRIESMLTADASYGEKLNSAIGFVQLLPTSYLPLFARHHGEMVLPETERGAFRPLTRAVDAMMHDYAARHAGTTVDTSQGQRGRKIRLADKDPVQQIVRDPELMRLAYKEAKPAYQAAIRNALVDRTPMTVLGNQTTRGIFLSAFLYQFYQDESPAMPADMLAKFGPEVISYSYWQLGPAMANQFFSHCRALAHWDQNDPRITLAANRLEAAREAVRADDVKLGQLKKQLAAAHPKAQKPAAHGKGKTAPQKPAAKTAMAQKPAVKPAGKSATKPAAAPAASHRTPLTIRDKQIMAQIDAVQRHRSAQLKQQQHWQKRAAELHAPWDNYVRQLGGQAGFNKDLWLDRNGHMKMPATVLNDIKKKLGGIPAAARMYAKMGVEPLLRYGTTPDVLARMPKLTEVNGRLVYSAPGKAGPALAMRPARVRVSYAASPKPHG